MRIKKELFVLSSKRQIYYSWKKRCKVYLKKKAQNETVKAILSRKQSLTVSDFDFADS